MLTFAELRAKALDFVDDSMKAELGELPSSVELYPWCCVKCYTKGAAKLKAKLVAAPPPQAAAAAAAGGKRKRGRAA